MRLLRMRFFYISNKKFDRMPIRPVRKDSAFINPAIPRAVLLPVFKVGKEIIGKKKPTKVLWPKMRLKEMMFVTYPTIKDYEWFTYKKIGGKIKRITLAQYILKRKA